MNSFVGQQKTIILKLQVGIEVALVGYGSCGAVAAVKQGVRREGEDFALDALDERLVVSSGQVGATYAAQEHAVASKHKLALRSIESKAALGVSGHSEHMQRLVVELKHVAMLEHAVEFN